MAIVIDASVMASALVERSTIGRWCEDWLSESRIIAPHLMPAEVTQVLRRAVALSDLSVDAAGVALSDLARMRVQLLPLAPVADRVWELRDNVSTYDAWYVAIAEAIDAPLVTLDGQLARASGPRCMFRTPPA